jgi:hypothetical protein
MINKYHILVFIFSFCFALIIGFLNSDTSSLSQLFASRLQTLAIVIYTLLLSSISYTGIWIYLNSKKLR